MSLVRDQELIAAADVGKREVRAQLDRLRELLLDGRTMRDFRPFPGFVGVKSDSHERPITHNLQEVKLADVARLLQDRIDHPIVDQTGLTGEYDFKLEIEWVRKPDAPPSGASDRAPLGKAEAYLAHPILGPRLLECTLLVNEVQGRSVDEIFGGVDTLKFRSSMTLFAAAAGFQSPFAEALRKYFGGQTDPLTIQRRVESNRF